MKNIITYVITTLFVLFVVSCGIEAKILEDNFDYGEWQSAADKAILEELNFARTQPAKYITEVIDPYLLKSNCPAADEYKFDVVPSLGKRRLAEEGGDRETAPLGSLASASDKDDYCYKAHSAKKYMSGEAVAYKSNTPDGFTMTKMSQNLSPVKQSLPWSLYLRDKARDTVATGPHTESIPRTEYMKTYGNFYGSKNKFHVGKEVARNFGGVNDVRNFIWDFIRDPKDFNDGLPHRLHLLGGANDNVVGIGYNPFDAKTQRTGFQKVGYIQIGYVPEDEFEKLNEAVSPIAISPKVSWTVLRVVDGQEVEL